MVRHLIILGVGMDVCAWVSQLTKPEADGLLPSGVFMMDGRPPKCLGTGEKQAGVVNVHQRLDGFLVLSVRMRTCSRGFQECQTHVSWIAQRPSLFSQIFHMFYGHCSCWILS